MVNIKFYIYGKCEECNNVGDMNAKLLEDVEELTLYIIEQQKEIEALKKAMKTINKQ